jgi:hypothetical protein
LDELDGVPDEGLPRESVVLSRALLERMSGGTLAVPELRTDQDVAIVSDLTFRWPALGDPEGWHVRFGRELNATDDRAHFVEARAAGPRGLPVIEGKHLSPFSVDVGASTRHISGADAARLLRDRAFERRRLAYRDVAAATNQLSLIAALVPAGVVTTHTLFCLKDPLDEESQHFLCGVLNSFVANYLIRPRISTHVGAGVIDRLPMPRPPRGSTIFRRLAAGAAALADSPSETSAALVQAMAARLYGVTEDQFSRVLATFPLVSGRAKEAATRAFRSM